MYYNRKKKKSKYNLLIKNYNGKLTVQLMS
jgi:hypothetical protein